MKHQVLVQNKFVVSKFEQKITPPPPKNGPVGWCFAQLVCGYCNTSPDNNSPSLVSYIFTSKVGANAKVGVR